MFILDTGGKTFLWWLSLGNCCNKVPSMGHLNTEHLFLSPGGWGVGYQVLAWSGSGRERRREVGRDPSGSSLWLFLYRTQSSSWGPPAWSHLNLITSQRSQSLRPSYWGLGCHIWIWGRHKHVVHNTWVFKIYINTAYSTKSQALWVSRSLLTWALPIGRHFSTAFNQREIWKYLGTNADENTA